MQRKSKEFLELQIGSRPKQNIRGRRDSTSRQN